MDKSMTYILATILEKEIPQFDQLLRQCPNPEIDYKADGSPVTKLDLLLSAHVELLMAKYFSGVTFYSEEKFSEWKFPLLALDPLDGTKEYIEGREEWAISIGLFPNENFNGQGWIYNPKTRECFDKPEKRKFELKRKYTGEVSRSEWRQGLYENKPTSLDLIPVGSIAYKLGRLAYGKCDFVVSLRPKNIWDIAGGTLLCHQAGFKFYSQGVEVKKVQQVYLPPLIWCHEEIFSELSAVYH